MQPLNFPAHIFLLSDHTTRALACDVTAALGKLSRDVFPCDFLEPLRDAIQAFTVDPDWVHDMGDPCQVSTELQDEINSLEAWYIAQHGEEALGQLAFSNGSIADNICVWRDASWHHIKPFVNFYKPHEILVVNLIDLKQAAHPTVTIFFHQPHPSAEDVVAKILEACQ